MVNGGHILKTESGTPVRTKKDFYPENGHAGHAGICVHPAVHQVFSGNECNLPVHVCGSRMTS